MKKLLKKSKRHVWFALADARCCRLLCCRLTNWGTPHVGEEDRFETEPLDHQHGRPMALAGMTGHGYAAPHHEIEEEERRAAAEITGWLERQIAGRGIESLILFAPPRMLGVLRKQLAGALSQRILEREGNLMHLQPDALAEHPMIKELIAPMVVA